MIGRILLAPLRWLNRITAPLAFEAYYNDLPDGSTARCDCDKLSAFKRDGSVDPGTVVFNPDTRHAMCGYCLEGGAGLGTDD